MKRTWTVSGDRRCYICGKKEDSKFEDGFNKWIVKSESHIPDENWERSFPTKVRLVEINREFSNNDTIIFNVCKTCLQVFQLDINAACFRYLFPIPNVGEELKIECSCDEEKKESVVEEVKERVVEEKEPIEEVKKILEEKREQIEEVKEQVAEVKEEVTEEKETAVEEKE